ncbi:MAG TPA: N-acetylmuramoyl-L-alanine amidase [Streptosporangiaceae bacterium]|nr:N-acetylmuramoyl-L-alanine amidase [Streptosporangiaceae bacterium]
MRVTWRSVAVGIVVAGLLAGCGSTVTGAAARTGSTATASASTGSAGAGSGSGSPPNASPAGSAATDPGSATASPAVSAPPPLARMTVGIDPGHNGGNFSDPGFIDQQVWNGRENENCDTTGTQTAGGYTEARFNFNVASYLRGDLVALGARVVMTRHSNSGVGPCITTRAEIINRAHANVAIDIHADGGPPSGRGFTVLEPVADGPNDTVIGPSVRFGADVRAALLKDTSMPESDYYGRDGLILRDDLAGLNLTTVPKVLVECGNMQNPVDARLLTRPSFQRRLARALTAAIVAYLTGPVR